MNLSTKLKEQRRTNRWLAEQLGRHESEVSRYCHGLVPSAETQRQIARILHTTPATLGWPEEKKKDEEVK